MPPSRKTKPARKSWFLFLLPIALVAVLAAFIAFGPNPKKPAVPSALKRLPETEIGDNIVFAAYGKSASCKTCHEKEFQLWQPSHHGLAERPIDPQLDVTALHNQPPIH